MFEEFARNPESVPAEWREIFRNRKADRHPDRGSFGSIRKGAAGLL